MNSTNKEKTQYSIGTLNTQLQKEPHPLPNNTISNIAIADMQAPYDIDRPDTVDCQLDLSARVIRNLSVTNGTFNPGIWEDLKLKGVNISSTIGDSGTQENGTASFPLYVYKVLDDRLLNTDDQTFNITQTDFLTLQDFLRDVLYFQDSYTNQFTYLSLFNISDRVDTIKAMAQGITYEFARGSGGTKIEGIVTGSELYIKVNWPWIVLPLAEVVMGIAFMLCTLIYNHRMGVTVWKSSNIVPLLIVMVGWESEELEVASSQTLEERSMRMKGRLVPGAGGMYGLYRTE